MQPTKISRLGVGFHAAMYSCCISLYSLHPDLSVLLQVSPLSFLTSPFSAITKSGEAGSAPFWWMPGDPTIVTAGQTFIRTPFGFQCWALPLQSSTAALQSPRKGKGNDPWHYALACTEHDCMNIPTPPHKRQVCFSSQRTGAAIIKSLLLSMCFTLILTGSCPVGKDNEQISKGPFSLPAGTSLSSVAIW